MNDWRKNPEVRARRRRKWLQFAAGLFFLAGILASFGKYFLN